MCSFWWRVGARTRRRNSCSPDHLTRLVDPGGFARRAASKWRPNQVDQLFAVPQEGVVQLVPREKSPTDHFPTLVKSIHRCGVGATQTPQILHALALLPQEWVKCGKTCGWLRRGIGVREPGDLSVLVDQTRKCVRATERSNVLHPIFRIPHEGAGLGCALGANVEGEAVEVLVVHGKRIGDPVQRKARYLAPVVDRL